MTIGIATADLYLLPRATISAGIGDEVVVGVNATLALAGAAAGGLLTQGRGSRKVAFAVGAGVLGVVAYFGLLLQAVVLVRQG